MITQCEYNDLAYIVFYQSNIEYVRLCQCNVLCDMDAYIGVKYVIKNNVLLCS